MEDKAVCTTCDNLLPTANSNCQSNTLEGPSEVMQWNMESVDQLLRLLLENKIMAMKLSSDLRQNHKGGISSRRRKRYSDQEDSEISSDKYAHKRYHHHHHHHHSHDHNHHNHHHHHGHHRYHEQHRHRHDHEHHEHHEHDEYLTERCSSISKVQRWSEDLDMDGSFVEPPPFDDWDGTSPSPNQSPESSKRSIMKHKDGYTVVSVDNSHADRPAKRKKRKRKKRRRRMEHESSKASHIVDSEDLPKRARWTIIITSGLLILACMFLVGITLRMAPIIDQMVRTQNEELMISLNRNINQSANSGYLTDSQLPSL